MFDMHQQISHLRLQVWAHPFRYRCSNPTEMLSENNKSFQNWERLNVISYAAIYFWFFSDLSHNNYVSINIYLWPKQLSTSTISRSPTTETFQALVTMLSHGIEEWRTTYTSESYKIINKCPFGNWISVGKLAGDVANNTPVEGQKYVY